MTHNNITNGSKVTGLDTFNQQALVSDDIDKENLQSRVSSGQIIPRAIDIK